VGEQVCIIRSHHPCGQDAPFELLLGVEQANWPLIRGLLGAFQPREATFLLRTLASDPSSLRGLVRRCATAKSHGIRFPWVWVSVSWDWFNSTKSHPGKGKGSRSKMGSYHRSLGLECAPMDHGKQPFHPADAHSCYEHRIHMRAEC
jgi:hypothetical protein